MTRDRTQLSGAVLAVTLLVILIVPDVLIAPDVAVLTSLFALPPLVACAVVPVRGTAVVSALSSGAAFASGWWNENLGEAQQNIRILTVVLIAVAAVAIAAVRVHREQRFAEVSAIAGVAQRAILPLLPEEADQVRVGAR